MAKIHKIYSNKDGKIIYEEKKSVKKRERVNILYYRYEISKEKIAKEEKVSLNFVKRWIQEEDMDFEKDDRGWPKGKLRKWDRKTIERIERIRKELEQTSYYIGSTAVEMEWRKRYSEPPPPLRTIGRIVSDLGLSTKGKKKREKGAARYLCYPEHTIYNLLGNRVVEVDFIGERYLTGGIGPLNFFGFSCKKSPKLRYYMRVEGQTSSEIERCLRYFIEEFERPHYIKIDNCAAAKGSLSGKRSISKAVLYLLEQQVIPIFSVPRRPFTQASIEGSNSVFSKKFWNRINFNSLDHLDEKLEDFNEVTLRYKGYKRPEEPRELEEDFEPKIYFTRQVQEQEGKDEGFIKLVNEEISIEKRFIKYFVLAEWDLKSERLMIRFEQEKESKIIKEIDFKINKTTREKCVGRIL